LLTRDLFATQAAWVSCLLAAANPLLGFVVVNVLSEGSFALFWTWGLWSAVRFLREGRFLWLPLALLLGALAYFSRPEGALLALALLLSLAILPFHRSTRVHWPRWAAAMALIVLGSAALAGPYIAVKGALATRPAIARVLGLSPSAQPDALEREQPLHPGQTTITIYGAAIARMTQVIRASVPAPLFAFAVLGLWTMPRSHARARILLFFSIVIVVAGFGLVRLHATSGYCSVRHGIVLSLLFTMTAAHGVAWLLDNVSMSGKWLGFAQERLSPGPAVWAVVIALLIAPPKLWRTGSLIPGPFHAYRDAADWLVQNGNAGEKSLDVTDWCLYFGNLPGYRYAESAAAPADPSLRWVIAHAAGLEDHWNEQSVVGQLVGRREPATMIPKSAEPGRIQIWIYDRSGPVSQVAAADPLPASTKGR
jgi:hypothetical protein